MSKLEKCDYPGCGRMLDPKGMPRHKQAHRPGGAPYLAAGKRQGRPRKSYTTVRATGISPRKTVMDQADSYAQATTLVKAESALFTNDAVMAVADGFFSEDPYLWNAFIQLASIIKTDSRDRKMEGLSAAIEMLGRRLKNLQMIGD